MNNGFLVLPLLASMGVTGSAATAADPAPASTYAAQIAPEAFRPVPLEHRRRGVTTTPAMVRLIAPGMDKFSIYRLIGPPHFGEGITRRWNYVLFFPPAAGETERVRCRMEIRFERPRGGYNVTVSEVVWQDQTCRNRVAAAS